MKDINGCETHSIKNGLADDLICQYPTVAAKMPCSSQESRRRINEVGETTRESFSIKLSLSINQLNKYDYD